MINDIEFIIPLVPVTKKNSQRIVYTGKFYKIMPSKTFMAYERSCAVYLRGMDIGIAYPVNLKALYYMPTKRRVDLVNLHEALQDVLVKYGVLQDDASSIVVSTDGSRVLLDRENPRTEVFIHGVENEEH